MWSLWIKFHSIWFFRNHVEVTRQFPFLTIRNGCSINHRLRVQNITQNNTVEQRASVTHVTAKVRPSYRPQRSCGQGNIFTPVCHSVHRGVSRTPPPGRENPPGRETPPWQGEPPLSGRENPPWQGEPPLVGRPPRLGEPHPSHKETPPPTIRSMSGRYASYWNAFLFDQIVQSFIKTTKYIQVSP